MDHISYTDFRNKLSSVLDQVNENHTPILITRRNGTPAVLISLEDFKSYDETAYLMASPANRKRLNEAIRDIENGKLEPHELITP